MISVYAKMDLFLIMKVANATKKITTSKTIINAFALIVTS